MSEHTTPKTERYISGDPHDENQQKQQEQQTSAGSNADGCISGDPHEDKEQQEQKRTETENLFHKLYLFGLGLQKDVETTVKNLIERGEVEAEEKEKMVNELIEQAKESGTQFENKIRNLINQVIEGMNLAPKEKHDALEKRVQILEMKILELESQIRELHPK